MADRDYFSRLRETQLGQDLYEYLLSRQKLPSIKTAGNMVDGVNGVWQPDDNQIWLQPYAGNNTLTHEVAHAADSSLERQYSGRPLSWGRPVTPTYFTDAYEKLKTGQENRYSTARRDMAKKMAPEWYNKNEGYRASTNELAGWGAGRQAGGSAELQYSPPNHLDSTMATELSILMELARRNDKPFPKQPSWFDRLFGR